MSSRKGNSLSGYYISAGRESQGDFRGHGGGLGGKYHFCAEKSRMRMDERSESGFI